METMKREFNNEMESLEEENAVLKEKWNYYYY